ncbi:hypothetical protein DMB44_04165 [Thermoplasma sp. Kam2015]|uniref:hypothetical protein n=1 Tax=Thermoplasma sp. Kam2015 TaxID=2094122 RepID=UPI000D86704E|nr:hypothetical protein [Thermoplasma sp. Kam2015]PYB68535.1 hypothetical protein DMB44_04165 [Thermoplasma sp. Kam2015]
MIEKNPFIIEHYLEEFITYFKLGYKLLRFYDDGSADVAMLDTTYSYSDAYVFLDVEESEVIDFIQSEGYTLEDCLRAMKEFGTIEDLLLPLAEEISERIKRKEAEELVSAFNFVFS